MNPFFIVVYFIVFKGFLTTENYTESSERFLTAKDAEIPELDGVLPHDFCKI
ncbi:MAG TPA: hypothetical protein VL125_01940 [Pelobium sp.]|nr:hypothetical protein [Pelobium sp.]